MSKKYSPIITKATKEIFFDYIGSINLKEIDYFAIGIQSKISKKSISLMSLEEWQKQFNYNQYAESDPLRKATFSTNRKIIPFNEIDHNDNFGKEIMIQRANFGIKHGVVLMERFPQYNYIITLGTGYKKFDSFNFIQHHYYNLQRLKSDLIKIIDKDAKNFLLKEIIKPKI